MVRLLLHATPKMPQKEVSKTDLADVGVEVSRSGNATRKRARAHIEQNANRKGDLALALALSQDSDCGQPRDQHLTEAGDTNTWSQKKKGQSGARDSTEQTRTRPSEGRKCILLLRPSSDIGIVPNIISASEGGSF